MDKVQSGRGARHLDVATERWQMSEPIAIAGYTMHDPEPVVVTITERGHRGRGEALGVYYHGDTAERIRAQIEAVREQIEAGAGRFELQQLLPPGGARNAVDCALWDLEAKRSGTPVYALAGLDAPRPQPTTYTLPAGAPDAMAARASDGYRDAIALKIKLLGDELDAPRVRAIRAVRPDVWLGVDVNQSYSRQRLAEMIPVFVEAGVELVEQPCMVGDEAMLDGRTWPIALAADESVQSLIDVDALVGRFQVVNIKLDKCGGLTEALRMAARARELGLRVMVGNMGGTSLAMAPALVLGQLCDLVDLDGPLFLSADREPGVRYACGHITAPSQLWGWPE